MTLISLGVKAEAIRVVPNGIDYERIENVIRHGSFHPFLNVDKYQVYKV
jgi:hypothetical protein